MEKKNENKFLNYSPIIQKVTTPFSLSSPKTINNPKPSPKPKSQIPEYHSKSYYSSPFVSKQTFLSSLNNKDKDIPLTLSSSFGKRKLIDIEEDDDEIIQPKTKPKPEEKIEQIKILNSLTTTIPEIPKIICKIKLIPVSSLDDELKSHQTSLNIMNLSNFQFHNTDENFEEYLENDFWYKKYFPKSLTEAIGNNDIKISLNNWLIDHQNKKPGMKKACLLLGPPGIGKTAFVKALALENKYEFSEVSILDEIVKTQGVGKKKKAFIHKNLVKSKKKKNHLEFVEEEPKKKKSKDNVFDDFVDIAVLPKLLTQLKNKKRIVHIEAADSFGDEKDYKRLFSYLQPSQDSMTVNKSIKTSISGKQFYKEESSISWYPHPLIITANTKTKNISDLSKYCEIFKMQALSDNDIIKVLDYISFQEKIIPTPLNLFLTKIQNEKEKTLLLKTTQQTQFNHKSFYVFQRDNEDNLFNDLSSLKYNDFNNDNVNKDYNNIVNDIIEKNEKRKEFFMEAQIFDVWNQYNKFGKVATINYLIAFYSNGNLRKAIDILEYCSKLYDKQKKLFKKEACEVIFTWTQLDNSKNEYANQDYKQILENRYFTYDDYEKFYGAEKSSSLSNCDAFSEITRKVEHSSKYFFHTLYTHLLHTIDDQITKTKSIDHKTKENEFLNFAVKILDSWSIGDDYEKSLIENNIFGEEIRWADIFKLSIPIGYVVFNNLFNIQFVKVYIPSSTNKMFDSNFEFIHNNTFGGNPKASKKDSLTYVKSVFITKQNTTDLLLDAQIFFHKFFPDETYVSTFWNSIDQLNQFNQNFIQENYPLISITEFYNKIKVLLNYYFNFEENQKEPYYFQYIENKKQKQNEKDSELGMMTKFISSLNRKPNTIVQKKELFNFENFKKQMVLIQKDIEFFFELMIKDHGYIVPIFLDLLKQMKDENLFLIKAIEFFHLYEELYFEKNIEIVAFQTILKKIEMLKKKENG